MTQPITQERIAEIRELADYGYEAEQFSTPLRDALDEVFDALTASLAEAQRLAEIVDIRKAARESLVEALKLQEIGAMMDLHVGDNIATRILPWMLAKDEEVSRLRDELARRDEIELSEECYGMLAAHGSDGVMLVCGEVKSGREFREKYRVARRDAVRVEVPELTYEAFAEIMDSTESLLGIRQRETVRRERITAWFRARLVPANPQAAAVVVPREEQLLREVGELTLAIRSAEEVGIPNTRAYVEANDKRHKLLDDLNALRTSAQDHNDNETRG